MYHYTESGLKNVWLQNGYVLVETPYGDGVSIEDADGLHEVLALRIACKSGPVDGDEFRFLRTLLGLSQSAVARMLKVTEQTVSLWERKDRVPIAAGTHLRLLALGRLDGDKTVREFLSRVNTVERIVRQRIVARESRTGWKATTKSSDQTAEA